MVARRRRQAFYVVGEGNDPELVMQGIRKLAELSKANGSTVAYVIVPKLDILTEYSVSEAIGMHAAETLAKGNPVKLTDGAQLVALSERTIGHGFLRGPVLALYCEPKFLTKIDSASGNSPMVIVSWLEAEGRTWINKYQAQPVGADDDGETSEAPRISNPVVEEALKSLTARVNLSTGLAHPNDHDAGVHMFRILKKGKQEIDFDELPG